MILPKSILVVEDDPSVAEALRLLLTIDRHQIEVAGDGETTLAKYQEGKYDLVITDFSMPGIDGLDLAGLIRARAPQQLVLLVTAHAETVSSNEKGRLQYIDGMLAKPFAAPQLQEAIRTVFSDD
jgi:DNA-binding response OmpR family regulator